MASAAAAKKCRRPSQSWVCFPPTQPQVRLMHQRGRLQGLAGLSWASFSAASRRSSS